LCEVSMMRARISLASFWSSSNFTQFPILLIKSITYNKNKTI